MKPQLLLADDDRFLLENVGRLLEAEGFEVQTVASGEEALLAVENEVPALAILDVGLPDMEGFELCERLRGRYRFPIIMLTARDETADKIQGLDKGADDYLTKPFEPGELVARVKAHLRRSKDYSEAAAVIQIGDLTIDRNSRIVTVGDRRIDLTNKEFALLAHLAENRGKVLSREKLFSHSWGFDIEFGSNSLDVYVYRLRKKLERSPDRPRYLHTIKGYGYKLDDTGDGSPTF